MTNKREVKEKEMQFLIKKYKESGQTQAVFCKENNINKSVLQYWLRKQREPVAEFVEMDVAITKTNAAQITIRCTNGTIVEIPI